MMIPDLATLSLLRDSDLTVADPDEDIRGRTVKDKDGKEMGRIDDLLFDADVQGFASYGSSPEDSSAWARRQSLSRSMRSL